MVSVSIITYKCPNCGGPLEFNGDTQNWQCEFCLSGFNEEEIKAIEEKSKGSTEKEEERAEERQAGELQAEDAEFENKARVYSCNSCGAEIVTDETTAATFCYYCHNPAILPGQLAGAYRPAKVIPFKFERQAATELFIKWCKKKPLLSKDFTGASQLELLSGIYIPFWLFDCDIKGGIRADGRTVRTWTSGEHRYTETKHYDVFRAGKASFGGIPADGSKKADDHLMQTLEPYDYSQLQDFSMSYLSGYLAEKYDMDDQDVYGRIETRVQEYSQRLLQNTITGYSSVSVRDCNIDIYESKATYVLLPTWMFTYNYKGKVYMFAMNGQTGKIAGNLPISKLRAMVWFALISAAVFIVLLLGGMFI
ncbi:MAG: hypothetical protein K0R69_2734 [Clostridia bacterium]|jgi:DNA-directed RNA polymerase subunit RPC12/RpoP|nr:hypothetical protein [Clostridia bacterium]